MFWDACSWFLCTFRGHRLVASVNRDFEIQKLDKNPHHTIQGKNLGFVICADCGKSHKIEKYCYPQSGGQICITYNKGQEFTTSIPR